jgi:undecaprenyl-diphosphatase
MNDRIQDLINGLAGHSGLLDSLMRFSATDLVFLLAIIPPVLWFWPASPARRAQNQRIAATAVFSVAIALGIAWLAGHLYSEARPFVSDSDTTLLISHSADNSFPSDHATFAAAIAGVLLIGRPPLGAIALIAVIAVAVARVYVGVHWPGDVVVALVIGFGTGWLLMKAERLLVAPQRAFSRILPPLLVSPP